MVAAMVLDQQHNLNKAAAAAVGTMVYLAYDHLITATIVDRSRPRLRSRISRNPAQANGTPDFPITWCPDVPIPPLLLQFQPDD
jgi:hypothetical protein